MFMIKEKREYRTIIAPAQRRDTDHLGNAMMPRSRLIMESHPHQKRGRCDFWNGKSSFFVSTFRKGYLLSGFLFGNILWEKWEYCKCKNQFYSSFNGFDITK
jgi:hypothetical protein